MLDRTPAKKTQQNSVFDTVVELARSGVELARDRGWICIVERSDRSEATYLHVERDAGWFGYRIASHEPFYPCSATYEQILVPRIVNEESLNHYTVFLSESMSRAGKVVADPSEVQSAIAAAELRHADAVLTEDSNRSSWRWCADERVWVSRLSAHGCSRIRHRLNFLAQWCYDEQQRDRHD